MSCNSRESIPHFSYVQKSQPYYQQNLLSPPHLNKSINTKIIIDPAHQNPVSPIVINNHLKKNGFVVPLSFILICTLVGIGFCLVFYQMIMDWWIWENGLNRFDDFDIKFKIDLLWNISKALFTFIKCKTKPQSLALHNSFSNLFYFISNFIKYLFNTLLATNFNHFI